MEKRAPGGVPRGYRAAARADRQSGRRPVRGQESRKSEKLQAEEVVADPERRAHTYIRGEEVKAAALRRLSLTHCNVSTLLSGRRAASNAATAARFIKQFLVSTRARACTYARAPARSPAHSRALG